MKIKKVRIQAFRAYKDICDGTFDFSLADGAPANFVAIYAPNGFGKSSFYDAVEWAFTKNIGRYVRSSNKSNNTAIANNEKKADKPQYIIRNHEAPPAIDTVVSVVTTEKIFKRKASAANLGKRDFAFNSKVAKGTEPFRDIFLSQEGVDAFIRESKPADRYERFTDSFCLDAENARKKLQALRFENAQLLSEIDSEISDLQALLDQPIDLTAFDSYNVAVDSLGVDGQNLKVSEDSFDQGAEGDLAFRIANTIQRFEAFIERNNNERDQLKYLLANIDGAKLIEVSLHQTAEQVTLLATATQESQQYKTRTQDAAVQQAELASLKVKLTAINNLSLCLPKYEAAKQEISIANASIGKTSLLLADEETAQTVINDSLTNLSKKISDLDATLNQWGLFKSAATQSYLAIQSDLKLSKEAESKAREKELRLQALNLREKGLSGRLTKIDIPAVDRNNAVAKLTGLIILNDESVLQLTACNRKISQADLELSENLLALKLANEQSGLFDQLSALGKLLIDEHKGPNCPLCNHKFDNHIQLLTSIATNDAVSSLQRYLQQQSLLITAKREEELDEAERIVTLFQRELDETIESTRNDLTNLRKEIEGIETDLSLLRNQISQATARLESLRAHTLQMDEAALAAHISKEARILEVEKEQLVLARNTKLHDLVSSGLVSAQLKQDVQNLELSLKQSRAIPEYLLVVSYIAESDLLPGIELAGHFSQEISQLDEEIWSREVLFNQASIDASTLQASMKLAGTWLRDAEIEKSYTALTKNRHNWLRSNSAFSKAVSDALGMVAPLDLESARKLLECALSKAEKDILSASEKKQTTQTLKVMLPALLPYISHLSYRRTMPELQLRKLKHTAAQVHLDNEIGEVIAYLKTKISSFFYQDLINDIYRKIDPHPNFKSVEFLPSFSQEDSPGLHILVVSQEGKRLPPTLYFSAAQLNILSLSIFLAKAIHANNEGRPLDVILIDDPMHSMDSINILSTIDLLRNITSQLGKQVIISTHDENFYMLLQKKIHSDYGSKFLRLESYGVVRTER